LRSELYQVLAEQAGIVARKKVVTAGSVNHKPGTSAEHRAENDLPRSAKCLIFRIFFAGRFVDMVGVTGSIPVAPTMKSNT
jgi:hypothetical protein